MAAPPSIQGGIGINAARLLMNAEMVS